MRELKKYNCRPEQLGVAVEDMAKNIDAQVKTVFLSSEVISIALDESIDVNSMAKQAIIIRFWINK